MRPNTMQHIKTCLGIDPGISHTGWAVLRREQSGIFFPLGSGVIRTDTDASDAKRYRKIFDALNDLVTERTPDLIAVEDVYFNKNVTSCLKTAGVIAVCLLAAERSGVASVAFRPQHVKSAATGNPRATKAQVNRSLFRLLRVRIKNPHACDAAAVAIAGLLTKSGETYAAEN